MVQPTYEYSGVCYTATSGQITFALTSTAGRPIGYLSPSHIYVRTSIDSGETWSSLPVNTGWTFADPATSIVLTTPATADEWVDIQRKTPIDEDWIDFQSGSLLTAGQLNEAETFSLYCDQELADGGIAPDLSKDTTDDLREGSVNLYYTDARVESYVSGAGYTKGGVSDAPSDGNTYGRKDENWVVVGGGEGGDVLSVNGQTGAVLLSINDLTDVDTDSAGHTPSDGQYLVWDAAMDHWMPGTLPDNSLNISALPALP